MKMQV